MAEVVQNHERNRFEVVIDGDVAGSSTYRLFDDRIVFLHTEVDSERQEGGLGSTLVRAALDQVGDTTQLRVVAQCPFVAHFIQEHPEYQLLLVR